MRHESDEELTLNIYNATVSFSDVYQKDDLSASLLESIKSADIILLPYEEFRGHENCFPEQTAQFYSFLKKEAAKHDLLVDIGASDEEYKELELHADVVSISEMLIQWTVFPILTGIVSAYLYDLIEHQKRKMNVRIKMSVEKKGKTKTIEYEGDIENFEGAMKSIKENIFND